MNNESVISKLLPRSLIDELPEPELKGLGLLAREIADSDIFEIDDEYNIHTMYHDVRVSLHVHESVKRRLKGGNRHLSCSVEFWEYDICILVPGDTPATDDCLVFLLLAKCGWRKDMVPMTQHLKFLQRSEIITKFDCLLFMIGINDLTAFLMSRDRTLTIQPDREPDLRTPFWKHSRVLDLLRTQWHLWKHSYDVEDPEGANYQLRRHIRRTSPRTNHLPAHFDIALRN